MIRRSSSSSSNVLDIHLARQRNVLIHKDIKYWTNIAEVKITDSGGSFYPVLAREKVPVHFQPCGSTAWFMIYPKSPETVKAGEWQNVQDGPHSLWPTKKGVISCFLLVLGTQLYILIFLPSNLSRRMRSLAGIFPCGSVGKESTCNEGDLGSIPGLERSPGEGKGYLLQCSDLDNSMDGRVHGFAESDTTEQLSPHFRELKLQLETYTT